MGYYNQDDPIYRQWMGFAHRWLPRFGHIATFPATFVIRKDTLDLFVYAIIIDRRN